MDDLFNWGNDKFVLGRALEHKTANGTVIKRKKSPQEIFMEAILEEDAPVVVETAVTEEEVIVDDQQEIVDDILLDRDTFDDEEEATKDKEL